MQYEETYNKFINLIKNIINEHFPSWSWDLDLDSLLIKNDFRVALFYIDSTKPNRKYPFDLVLILRVPDQDTTRGIEDNKLASILIDKFPDGLKEIQFKVASGDIAFSLPKIMEYFMDSGNEEDQMVGLDLF